MMKRDDFEELVRLLRAWLQSEGTDAKRTHSRLRDWADRHSRESVQGVSDSLALASGLDIERQGYSRWVMEIGNRDGKTFFSAIDAIDHLLRRIVEAGADTAADAITTGKHPWSARIPLVDIDRSLVALRSRLGEELKHLDRELRDEHSRLVKVSKPAKPRGKGRDSIDSGAQSKRVHELLRSKEFNLTIESSAKDFVDSAKVKWPDKVMIRIGTVKTILNTLREQTKRTEA
ncbi:ROK family protein [Blastopirellula marina]|uniref:Uncharacterized protein n=1 Tax=Blastopirellula marina TaxID=124 RepID=A0A2S8GQK8_9BACT|nr:ROK family protein [Blastopirellula marina]PQO46715.1 hypothetical protein C5Y93_07730 [Blastopirellula marina]